MTHLIMPQTLSGKRHQNSGYNFKETGQKRSYYDHNELRFRYESYFMTHLSSISSKDSLSFKNDRSVYRFEYLTSGEIDSSF